MATFDKWVSAAGPDMPVGEVAREAVKLRLAAVVHFLPLAAHLADEDVEYVHDARVATRRAAAALRLYRAFLPSKRRKRMKKSLGEIRSSMGEARDLDVFIARLQKTADERASSFVERLARQRCAAQMTIIDCATPLLKKQRLRRRAARLVDKIGKGHDLRATSEAFGDWARRELDAQWRKFLTAAPEHQPSADALHEFRIAGKRLRYAIELLSSGLPQAIRERAYPEIKQLQDQLGEIQDHAVAAERLHAWGAEATCDPERELLAELERNERSEFDAKSEAFKRTWKRDRLDGVRKLIEEVTITAAPL